MRRSSIVTVVALVVSLLAVVAVRPPSAFATDEPVTGIGAGGYHTCAITDGELRCWGRNLSGELGDGTTNPTLVPVPTTSLPDPVVAVTGGSYHTCALTDEGGVYCWGYNGHGQLGNGTKNSAHAPVAVAGLGSGVVAINAGSDHTCAVTAGNELKCWGDNDFGEIGDGTTTDRTTPTTVSSLGTNVAGVGAGQGATCAVTTTGTAWCWGYNGNGRLGDGTTTNRSSPVPVSGLATGVTGIATFGDHSCAIVADGVRCWGGNEYGQLGDGTTVDRSTPVSVAGIGENVTKVTGGNAHTCALVDDGVQCWGWNNQGQLGNATTTDSTAPVTPAGLGSGVTDIDAAAMHTCVLTETDAVMCWGVNDMGTLGIGAASELHAPTDVALDGDIAQVVSGYHHSCAVTTAGAAWCWGDNAKGQIGDGTVLERPMPTPVAGLEADVVEMAAGYDHTCAVTSDGEVTCWGDNQYGQLGDGSTTERHAPTTVSGLSDIVEVAAGVYHTCARSESGAVSCWGYNQLGAIGDGTMVNVRLTATQVSGITSGATQIDAGNEQSCARLADGSAKCWGGAYVGDGSNQHRPTPTVPTGMESGVASVTAGSTACALLTTGAVKCWGGRNGDGTSNTALTAGNPTGLSSGITAVESAGSGACVLTATSTVKCWGSNSYGEVGDGTTIDRKAPTAVVGLENDVTEIAPTGDHVCVLLESHRVQCWGNNWNGQLGNGVTGRSTVPVAVTGLGLGAAMIPGVPGSVAATPANGAAELSWSAPTNSGGASVYGYAITVTDADGAPATVSGATVRTAASTSYSFSGLTNGTDYRLDIAPLNRAGRGPSVVSALVRPSSAPPTTTTTTTLAPPTTKPPKPTPPKRGYWMVGATGSVYTFGNLAYYGRAAMSRVRHLEPRPNADGYWIVNASGMVKALGAAKHYGNSGALALGESVTSLSSTATGKGYWIFTSRGRVFPRGDAKSHGDLRAYNLKAPIVGSVATPSGKGYYLVGRDGGVFTFGDARFRGSTGAKRLNAPITTLVPTPDNKGYWLVATDGGVFSFNAPFRGSAAKHKPNAPIVKTVAYGNGYVMVASDGGVFTFSNKPFVGSLSGKPLAAPIVSIGAHG